MALRSLLRKAPALGARSWPMGSVQKLSPAAGSRLFSAEGGEADRVHAEFLESMKRMQQRRDEFWRLEDESRAKIRKKLDTIMMASNVTILLCVPAIVVMLMKM